MRANNLNGFFDVKVYRKGVAHEDRQTKAETETITFATTFAANDTPAELKPYAKPYTSQKDGSQRDRVTFKVNQYCTWWQMQNGNATKTPKPTNAELDGKRYTCTIEYNALQGDPKNLEPCGLWANDILWEAAQSANPFGDMETERAAPEPIPAPASQPAGKDDGTPF